MPNTEAQVIDSTAGGMDPWLRHQIIERFRAQIGAQIAAAKDDDERVMLARQFFEYEATLKRLVGAHSDENRNDDHARHGRSVDRRRQAAM